MDTNILISVIIPVYNAEQYIKRAVESILVQETNQIEVILVDDGSTDSSGKICDAYSKKSNVKVIHKDNGGVSTARNVGIKHAVGEYISFIDADDYMDLYAYEKILNVIEKESPDCIDFGWRYISKTGESIRNLNKLEKNIKLDKSIVEEIIIPPLINIIKDDEHFIYAFVCNKIFKAEILRKNNIFFDEERCTWEDRIFLVQYLKYCDSFYSLDECFYNYVSVPESLSKRYEMSFFEIILKNFETYQRLFNHKYNFETQYVWNYWCHSIENMILRSLNEKNDKKEIEKIILNVLQHEQVIEWYRRRDAIDDFEKQVSELVVNKDGKLALNMYKKKRSKLDTIEKLSQLKYKIRKILKG